jgi:phospholipase/carboxylesterase
MSVPSDRTEDKLPLIIMMHGRGADAHDLADVAPLLDGPGGYRFVFPNAPRPWEAQPGMTFGFTWFDGWPPRGESFRQSRRLVLAFLDAVVKRYPTPEGKLIISGFSQGALVALDVGFRTKQQVAAIVAMSGAIYEDELPDLDSNRDKRVLLVHGTNDEVIPVNAARRTRRVLEDHGIEPEYHEFPMGHQLTEESIAVVAEFISRSLARTGT